MNKEKIKISIIVPVYNKERYIGRCIKSLLYQTLKEIEIIVVDDGSTDDSLLIVEKISKQFDNIKIIKQKNSGCSSARNKGIELARGEYIGFVDPDVDRLQLIRQFF